jgi:hypothetical protein
MLTSDIVESSGGDVVSLSFADQCVVLQEISQFSWIEVGLFGQDFLCLAPGERGLVGMPMIHRKNDIL